MKRIIWLASYPKSGNTWLRVFFTNLRRNAAAPARINRLDHVGHAPDRGLFDRVVGYDAGDLTHDEVDRLRPEIYRYRARHTRDALFIKVHDAYTFLPDGQPLFPPEATAGAIYLIRNPLDVCVSYTHFGKRSCDEVIGSMADPRYELAGECAFQEKQLRQRLLTWSDHVLSWLNAPGLRIQVLRYEDLKARPVATFTAAAAFVGMTQDRARITRAVEFSSIEELQSQEREDGFQESHNGSFFRKGKAGAWREELTDAQVARIIRDHRDVMRRFGYLTETGEPVV